MDAPVGSCNGRQEEDSVTDSSIRSLTPLIHVASVPRSAAFYEQLGFEVKDSFTPPGSEEPSWASLW